MANIQGNSSKKFRVFYCDSSVLTNYTDYGQIIPETTLQATGVWKQLRVMSPLSSINLAQEPFKVMQSGTKILADIPEAGLQKPETVFDIMMHSGLEAAHPLLFKTGFGKLVAKTGSTTIATVASDTSFTLTSATGFAIGDIVKVLSATDEFKGFDVIANLATTTVTLQSGIAGLLATDKITSESYYDMQEVTDDKYYHLFVETEIGNFFILWNKISIDMTTEANVLLKTTFKFSGGSFLKTEKTYADLDTTTLETQVLKHTIGNFKKAVIGADTCRKVVKSTFTITRENVRMDSQCTENAQGNGGAYNDGVVATLDLQLNSYPEVLTNYEAGTSFDVLAYNSDLCIVGKGIVDSRVVFAENNNMIQPTIKIELNAVDGSPLRIVI